MILSSETPFIFIIDGHEMFANGDVLMSPNEEYIANIQTVENGAITPFSIYKRLKS